MESTTPDADNQLHVFSTFMGIPPDSSTPPVCGATLTAAYNGRNKPHCPECERILAEHRRGGRCAHTETQHSHNGGRAERRCTNLDGHVGDHQFGSWYLPERGR